MPASDTIFRAKHQKASNGINNREVAVRVMPNNELVVLSVSTENQRNTSNVQTVLLSREVAEQLAQAIQQAADLAVPPPSKADRIRQLLRDYGGVAAIPATQFQTKYGSTILHEAIENILSEDGDL